MDEHQARDRLPQAYALSLWLRDFGCSDRQIADVLRVDEESIPALLKLADAKVRRLSDGVAGSSSRPGVAVLIGGDDRLIDAAAALAHAGRSVLHLVAAYESVKRGAFDLTVSERRFREAAGRRRTAESQLLEAVRRAVLNDADVIPHLIASDVADAIVAMTGSSGPITLAIGAGDPRRRSLERAAQRARVKTVILDSSGQVTRGSADRRSPTPGGSRRPFTRLKHLMIPA